MQFNRLVMGVSNAPSYFQRLMDRVLSGVEEECANRRSTPGTAPAIGSPEAAPPGNSDPVCSSEPDSAGTSGSTGSVPASKPPLTRKGFVKNFLDDLLIYSDTWEEHLLHIRIVLERLNCRPTLSRY